MMTTSFHHCHHPQVGRFVQAFWQTEGAPAYRSETILPKGVIELIFSFSEPVPFSRNQQSSNQSTPRCFITGLSNTPVQLQTPQQQAFFGIELYPAAIKKILKIPAGRFLNAITDLELLDKAFGSLWHQLAGSDSFQERVKISEQWMMKKLSPVHEQEMAISAFLKTTNEQISVTGLASYFCYSARQLNRKTQELFGMSTEALISYKRYVHALQRVHYGQESLTRISYDCHYFDQAHFIREFKSYTGLTPGNYLQQKSSLPGHLFQ